jgi:hypothetical protein
MNGEVINALRRRMIEDMTARNLDEATQRGYLRAVRTCCRYCGRGPGQLTFEDIRRFQLQLMESGLAPGSVNKIVVGSRCFFKVSVTYDVVPKSAAFATRSPKNDLDFPWDRTGRVRKSSRAPAILNGYVGIDKEGPAEQQNAIAERSCPGWWCSSVVAEPLAKRALQMAL